MPSQYSAYADKLGSEMVTLLVGPGKEKFAVHKQLLVRDSRFFATALNNSFWKEARENTVVLEEDDPDAVRLLLCWLYEGRLPRVDPNASTPDFFGYVGPGPSSQEPADGREKKKAPASMKKPFRHIPCSIPEPHDGIEDDGAPRTASVLAHHICVREAFKKWSPEEIRLADLAQMSEESTGDEPLVAGSSKGSKQPAGSRLRQDWLDATLRVDLPEPAVDASVTHQVPPQNAPSVSPIPFGSSSNYTSAGGGDHTQGTPLDWDVRGTEWDVGSSYSGSRLETDANVPNEGEGGNTNSSYQDNNDNVAKRTSKRLAASLSLFSFNNGNASDGWASCPEASSNSKLRRFSSSAASALMGNHWGHPLARFSSSHRNTGDEVDGPAALPLPLTDVGNKRNSMPVQVQHPPSHDYWTTTGTVATGHGGTSSPFRRAPFSAAPSRRSTSFGNVVPNSYYNDHRRSSLIARRTAGLPSGARATDENEAHQLALLRLAALAERLRWDRLFNAAMTAFMDGEQTLLRVRVPTAHVALAYRATAPGCGDPDGHDSPLRALFADRVHYELHAASRGPPRRAAVAVEAPHSRFVELGQTLEDFLPDLFRRMDEERARQSRAFDNATNGSFGARAGMSLRDPIRGRRCAYHYHREWDGMCPDT